MRCPSCGGDEVHKSYPLGLPEGEFVIKCDSCNHNSNLIINDSIITYDKNNPPTHGVDRWVQNSDSKEEHRGGNERKGERM